MQLFAVQKLGGITNREPSGDLVVGVQAAPTIASGSVRFRSHLYECGRWVWIIEAVPGANGAGMEQHRSTTWIWFMSGR